MSTTTEMIAAIHPCDDLRPKFYFPERCHCGVLTELHTPGGWAEHFERRAKSCVSVADSLRQRIAELEASAIEYRAAAFPKVAE